MCGRYTLSSPGEAVAELLELDSTPRLAPRYNIAPTQESAVVRTRGDRRELAELRWGLVPYWAAKPAAGSPMINARSETVATKPAFRSSLRRRRCLVPANGFYEWRRTPGGKQPYLIGMKGGAPFAFAGLWDRWVPHEGAPLESFTILTTRPNELTAKLHDRMPVILPPPRHELWLDPGETDPDRLTPLLEPYPAGAMTAFAVSPLVNKPANDLPECVQPLPGWETEPSLDV